MSNLWKQLKDRHDWSDVQHGRGRERLNAHMRTVRAASEQTEAKHKRVRLLTWLHISPVVLVVVLAVLLGGSGVTVAASKNSAPHERLYPVRVMAERMYTTLSLNPQHRAERALGYSKTRLAELGSIAQAQAAAEGRAKYDVQIAADQRLKALQKSAEAMHAFSLIAQNQLEHMRDKDVHAEHIDPLAAQLDALLDASMGILISIEVNAPANEPVRAIVINGKKKISPLESKVESGINQHNAKRLESFPPPFTLTAVEHDEALGTVTVVTGTESEPVFTWSRKITIPSKSVKRDSQQAAQAQAKIERAGTALSQASQRLHQKKSEYGQDATKSLYERYERAQFQLQKSQFLFDSGDFHTAYITADSVLRDAARVRMYMPVMDKRATVVIDDEGQLRLRILPEYEPDWMEDDDTSDEE